MKTGSFLAAMTLGMAAGATAALMLPRQNAVRRTIQRAADTVEDALTEAADNMLHG